MLKRLFVDCDGTLLLFPEYDTPDSQINVMGTVTNQPLVDAIERWAQWHPDSEVVVWSGGGREYAAQAMRLFIAPVVERCTSWSKDTRLPVAGDLVVDDMELRSKGTLLLPDQFVSSTQEPE